MVKLPDIDDRPLTFGKYKGETPNEISRKDPQYLAWIYDNVTPCPVSKDLYNLIELGLEGEEEWS